MADPQPRKTPLKSPPDPKRETPNLTVNTTATPTTPATPAPPTNTTTPRSASPPPPPLSPITPTLGPTDKPPPADLPPRQTFAHAQPNQVGVPPPQPRPILLDENPDALALRSAIAVLQMQKRRAEGDIVALQRAKEGALGDPEGFTRDLSEGRIRSGGDAGGEGSGDGEGRPWGELPARQDVVRCPPVNWARYAVAGESLDKLHAEQRENPDLGVPATVAPDGTYEFKGEGEKRGLVGVAAPYTPGRDKIADKKTKPPRR